MLEDWLRREMVFYAETDDYSDAERYERFALGCKLDKKAFEIGRVMRNLVAGTPVVERTLAVLETASATGLTAVGVIAELSQVNVNCIYTSLDIEKNLLQYAMLRGRGNNFVRGDFEELPFKDSSFDIYIMMGAGGYRPKGTFYPEIYRVLKFGGYYVMPQIGPEPIVKMAEINAAMEFGFRVRRADNYLIAQKINNPRN